jgi:hypothetical protein
VQLKSYGLLAEFGRIGSALCALAPLIMGAGIAKVSTGGGVKNPSRTIPLQRYLRGVIRCHKNPVDVGFDI